MKRALMYASVASMIQQFNMNNIRILIDLGYEVDVACNFETGSTISNEKIKELKTTLDNLNVHYFQIDVPRQMTNIKDIRNAYRQTIKLMNERKYDLIHCHSPIGGVICRIANKNSTNYKNTRMIYTAHGFHFFKGNNSLKNILFRTIEKYAAKYTDVLITINQEDYCAAKSFRLKEGGSIEYVPGIGIDIDKISKIEGDKNKLCKELNIPDNSKLILSVGELNENKNHIIVIDALAKLQLNFHYLICGNGKLKDKLLEHAKSLGVADRVHLLGYRTDVLKIMKSCDVFAFPSKREGLSVALMEALACGLPCVASKIRGNSDLITDTCGILVKKEDEWAPNILEAFKRIKEKAWKIKDMTQYSVPSIDHNIREIYLDKESVCLK